MINRFLIMGKSNGNIVDYIYHGTYLEGCWASSHSIVDYQINNSKIDDPLNRALLSLGRMDFQVWNRGLTGSDSAEKKRGQLQIKYPKMSVDLTMIMVDELGIKGTFMGDMEEYDISKVMNRDKKHSAWDKFRFEDNSSVYVVKVNKRVYSCLSERKVLPKSDAYLVKADISKEFLLKNEYKLEEKDIESLDCKYDIIEGSGISVKSRYSNNFTIQKLTKNSFIKAFEKYMSNSLETFCGLLLYNDSSKNQKIFDDLSIDKDYFLTFLESEGFTDVDLNNSRDIGLIRSTFQEKVKNIIDSNHQLKESLFLGKNYFEEPYCIKYILRNSQLTTDVYYDYKITTGSGRSKSDYSIILKPI
ncbi:MAG: hypothetical protein LUH02_10615 [Erysipelotrichaceae bacterium]|nr:hypothetical protein [Erysipelotrichaceae bacterium]